MTRHYLSSSFSTILHENVFIHIIIPRTSNLIRNEASLSIAPKHNKILLIFSFTAFTRFQQADAPTGMHARVLG
jgi:hypothetical protein